MHFTRFICMGFTLLICAAGVIAAQAEELNSDALHLMDDLSRNCQAIKPLSSPLPTQGREVPDFHAQAKWVERDLKALRQYIPDPESSPRIVRGKPLGATIKVALATIRANQELLASKPKQEALDAIEQAITFGQTGSKWMVAPEKYGATFSVMAEYYSYYTQHKQRAEAIDPKALDARKADLKECEDKFVTPFLALKERLAREEAMRKAATEAAQNAENIKRQRVEAAERQQELEAQQAETARKASIAKAKGFDAPAQGVAKLINRLKAGRLSIEQAKTQLVFKADLDNFKVTSTDGTYAFYLLQDETGSISENAPMHIAIEKAPGVFYGNGSRLNQRMFAVVGVGTFANALGIGTDVVIFKAEAE